MRLKVLAHNVVVRFIEHFQEREDIKGQQDGDEKLICIEKKSSRGNRKPLSAMLVTFFHEVCHEIDHDTGHETFQDDNDEQSEIKEKALVGFSEGLVQVLLDNRMLSEKWLDKFKREIR